MRGGIQKEGNRWYAVVYDGIDPGTGKKRRRWVPAGTRRSDAERVLSDLIRRKYDGEPAPTEKLTVGQYLTQRWLPIQKSKVRASTSEPGGTLGRTTGPSGARRTAGRRRPRWTDRGHTSAPGGTTRPPVRGTFETVVSSRRRGRR